jgi:4-diphosphocytidyl-2-C-methyl-D-erythritol kinase
MTSTHLAIHSPAKVNLGLAVGPRRPDGFHDITTIFLPLEFGDTVRIARRASGISLRCTDPAVPQDSTNLAWRAAERFLPAASIDSGCSIAITKRIPVGSGLGGGSSNAAAVLLGLNRLHNRPLGARALRRVATGLGSDVACFLFPGPTVGRGRGERLRPIRLPRLHLLLYLPGHPVPTARAYAALDKSRARRRLTRLGFWPKMLAMRLRRSELDKAAALIRNDFEEVVFRAHPGLARAKAGFLQSGAWAAALSGSGSTVYGLVTAQDWHDPMAAMSRSGFPCIHTRSR